MLWKQHLPYTENDELILCCFVPFVINSQLRQIKLALFTTIALDANDKRQQHLACMLAKQVADNTSSGPINVLPRQMKPHEIPVIGNGDSTAGYIY